jgi:hypothetical protein
LKTRPSSTPLPTALSAEPENTRLRAMTHPEQKKSNLRLALILASVAAVFFAGFMLKMVVLGG